MVTDKNNKIFTELVSYIKDLYPSINYSTGYPENLAKFPAMFFTQIEASTKLTTLSNTEDGVTLAYQIDVYTNDGANKARKIANDIRTFMIDSSFRCINFMPVPQPSNVSRFVARYERLDV